MHPADIVALIDEWNPRAPELQESGDGMEVDCTHHYFVEKLVFRLDRLDLDALSVEGDERLSLEEAIGFCRSALQAWNADSRSRKKMVRPTLKGRSASTPRPTRVPLTTCSS